MNLYFVVITTKTLGRIHSVHKDQATAEHWLKCKQYDGDDCHIVHADPAIVDELRILLED